MCGSLNTWHAPRTRRCLVASCRIAADASLESLVGTNFREQHLQLDEIVDAAREASDTIAERMRALHAVPDGRSDTIAATTRLPAFPQGTAAVASVITRRLYGTVATISDVHDEVSAEEPHQCGTCCTPSSTWRNVRG